MYDACWLAGVTPEPQRSQNTRRQVSVTAPIEAGILDYVTSWKMEKEPSLTMVICARVQAWVTQQGRLCLCYSFVWYGTDGYK